MHIETNGKLQKTLISLGFEWWAHKGSNLGPLPCEGNALPLSYAPGILVHDRRNRHRIGQRTVPEPAIYEVRAMGVKLSGHRVCAKTLFC
jgi:hypothetical protein